MTLSAEETAAPPTPGSRGRPLAAVALWAVLALGAALRLSVAVLPERLLIRLTVDDAFYYVRTAQELVGGNGATFDGAHATNGFHPLWMTAIAPFAATGVDGSALIRILVVVQAALSIAAFLVMAHVLRPRIGTWATAFGLAWWWLAAPSVVTSVTGVEASIATLAVACSVLAAVTYVETPNRRGAVWLGVAAGIVFLSRSDAAFAVAAICAWGVVEVVRAGRPARTTMSDLAAAAAAGAVVVAPWWAWNLLTFGTVEQSSAAARPRVLWHEESLAGNTDSLTGTAATAAEHAGRLLGQIGPWMFGWPQLLLVGAALGAALVARRHGFGPGPPRRLTVLFGALVAAGILLAAIHSGVRLFAREYYFEWTRMSLGALVAVVAAGLAPAVRSSIPSEWRVPVRTAGAVLAVALIGLLGIARTLDVLRDPTYPWQPDMLEAARWIDESIPVDDTVVSFNAGILGYYSGRDVVNLDGAINNAAAASLAERDLAAFICSTGARWYADFDPGVWNEHVDFLGGEVDRLGLDPVHEVAGHGHGSSTFVVQRLDCAPG